MKRLGPKTQNWLKKYWSLNRFWGQIPSNFLKNRSYNRSLSFSEGYIKTENVLVLEWQLYVKNGLYFTTSSISICLPINENNGLSDLFFHKWFFLHCKYFRRSFLNQFSASIPDVPLSDRIWSLLFSSLTHFFRL